MKRCYGLRVSLLVALLGAAASTPAADWKKLLDSVPGSSSGSSAGSGTASAVSGLSQSEVGAGLKEALGQGVRRAVESLGRRDGFLGNPEVRIPMPEALGKVERALRAIGQHEYADEFVETMNRAAEEAVPQASGVFADAIRDMSLADAKQILSGPDDAATEYFRKNSSDALAERFRPIVARATDQVGLTSSYKKLVDNAGLAGKMLGSGSTDLDGYVTDRAIDGLLKMVAAEEQRIRTEPLARSTDLLKKVFR